MVLGSASSGSQIWTQVLVVFCVWWKVLLEQVVCLQSVGSSWWLPTPTCVQRDTPAQQLTHCMTLSEMCEHEHQPGPGSTPQTLAFVLFTHVLRDANYPCLGGETSISS